MRQLIFGSVLVLSLAGPADARVQSTSWAVPPTTVSFDGLKDYLKDRGEWLNPPFEKIDPDIQGIEQFIVKEILASFIQKEPRLGEIPIRVHIYKNFEPNAWVSLIKDSFLLGEDSEDLFHALGFDPDTGFIELGITTGLLEILRSKALFAALTAHEMGHVLKRHLQILEQSRFRSWWDSSEHEFEADDIGIRLMAGLFPTIAFPEALALLHSHYRNEMEEDQPLMKKIIDALSAATSTHPHEGVRIAMSEARARQERMRIEGLPKDEPLPPAFERAAQKFGAPTQLNHQDLERLKNVTLSRSNVDDFVSHLIGRQPETVIEQLPELLNAVCSDAKLKMWAYLRILRNLSYDDNFPIRSRLRLIRRSDHTAALEQWLNSIPEAEWNSFLTRSNKIIDWHQFLLAIGHGPREATAVSKLDKFILSHFKNGAIADYIFFGKAINFFNDLQSTTPALKREIIQIGLQLINTLTFQSAPHIVSGNGERVTPILLFQEALTFLNDISRLADTAPLLAGIQRAKTRLSNEIWRHKLETFHLPEVSSIREVEKDNRHPDQSLRGMVPDYSGSPFPELQWAHLLEGSEFKSFEARLVAFFTDLMTSSAASVDFVSGGIADSFHPHFEGALAKSWLSVPPGTAQFVGLRAWSLIRTSYGLACPTLSQDLMDAVTMRLNSISDLELSQQSQTYASMNLLSCFGRSSRLFESMSVTEVYKFVRHRNSIKLWKSQVTDELLLRLSRLVPNNPAEAKLWYSTVKNVLENSRSDYRPINGVLEALAEATAKTLKLLNRSERVEVLKSTKMRGVLRQEVLSQALVDEFLLRHPQARTQDHSQLPDQLLKMEKDLQLATGSNIVHVYRDQLAKSIHLQPQDRRYVDPNDNPNRNVMVDGSAEMIRYFSGFLELIRSYPIQEQLDVILFLAGHTNTQPKVFLDIQEKAKQTNRVDLDIFAQAGMARNKMAELSNVARSIVIDSFLTGPTGLLQKPGGLKMIEDQLLSSVSTDNRPFARILMTAIQRVEGRDYALLLSYALAQKSTSAQGQGEGSVLKALLESYGIPGIKFGQFLASMSLFVKYRKNFESFLDAANPLSYIGMLNLLEQELGVAWDPTRYEVIGVMGSGSVNIAIKVKDLRTGHEKVLNVLREKIEIHARHDFLRFRRLVKELHILMKDQNTLQFIEGLANLVEESVSVEFDKNHAKRMHEAASQLYSVRVGKWTVQAVQVHETFGRALEMSVAPGESAVKIQNSDLSSYNEAVRAYVLVSQRRLSGTGPGDKHISDLDIHNGQFFIDTKSKTITLLDKGQAAFIEPAQRQLALLLVRMAAQTISVQDGSNQLQTFTGQLGFAIDAHARGEFQRINTLKNVMDRYLNLLGYLRIRGKVPRAVVNWGFEFFRTRDLAAQVSAIDRLRFDALLLSGPQALAARAAFSVVDLVRCESGLRHK